LSSGCKWICWKYKEWCRF